MAFKGNNIGNVLQDNYMALDSGMTENSLFTMYTIYL